MQRLLCAATEMPTEPSTRESSSMTFDVVDVGEPGAAVLLREDDAQHPELAEPAR